MRIISGKYRGITLKSPSGNNTRPTQNMTREGIFNVLNFYLPNSNVLDIFAGSGALGFESLSRNALKVTFIDNNYEAIKVIKENAIKLNCLDKINIIKNDYKIIKNLNEKFDLIFFDPPYRYDVFDEIFKIINDNDLLNENGVIIYECDKNNILKGDFENYVLKTYRYGIAYVNILFKKSS